MSSAISAMGKERRKREPASCSVSDGDGKGSSDFWVMVGFCGASRAGDLLL